MSFQILSDIHLELLTGTLPKIHKIAPNLILSGDITNVNYKLKSSINFFKYCNDNWDKTIYILGNHECYSTHNTIYEMRKKYKDILKLHNLNNIIILDNDYYEIQTNTFIIGSTFWTRGGKFDSLNDYEYILWERKQKLTPAIMDELSKIDYEYIFTQTEIFKDSNIIMVTHFPPYADGTSDPKYNESDYKSYFTWDNDTLKILNRHNNIKCWISGHTHYSYDFVACNVRLLSNQYGYYKEKTLYNPNLLYNI